MEALVKGGFMAGVLDITTTELADELAGGVFSAGADRLEAAGNHGIPQVVSLGALDMVNFGPMDTVPEKYRNRRLYKHNPTVTLMRTTPEECAELGRMIVRKLNKAKGPVALFIPLRGVSMIATLGDLSRAAPTPGRDLPHKWEPSQMISNPSPASSETASAKADQSTK